MHGVVGEDETTALMWASMRGQEAVARLLLSRGARVNHANKV